MKSIGFIGLGIMGRGMARNLLRKGHAVTVYNRTRGRADELAALGAKVAASPAEAAREADVVVTMLADPPAVLEVVEGPKGILETIRRGAVVIDSSTVSPATSLRVAEKLGAKGAAFLDAPVFGSKNEAEKGELGFMVGGDRAVLDGVQDVFAAKAKAVRYVGGPGMGAYAKLVFNLVVAISLEAFNEGMALATRAGIDPSLMYEMMMSGRARSAVMEMKGPQVLKRDFTPFFALRLMDKDLQLALETAHAMKLPMPALAATKQVFSSCMASGQADEDFSTTIKFFERLIGAQVGGPKA